MGRYSDNPQFSSVEHGWGSQLESLFILLSYSVGLGNVWRFPYLCHEFGGAVFIIAYLCLVLVLGIPTLIQHISIGQVFKVDAVTVFQIQDRYVRFSGLGYHMLIASIPLIALYFIIIGQAANYVLYATEDIHDLASNASEEFYYINRVGLVGDGFDDFSHFNMRVAMIVLLLLVVVFIILVGNPLKTEKSSKQRPLGYLARFSKICIILPYICMGILLGTALKGEGAVKGIKRLFIVQDWGRLLQLDVWYKAANQIVFTTGCIGPTVITLSRYNSKSDPFISKTLYVVLGNFVTSIFATCLVFSVIGILEHRHDVAFDHVVKSGPPLIFLTLPTIFKEYQFPRLMKFIFFSAITFLGMGTVVQITKSIVDGALNIYPSALGKYTNRETKMAGYVLLSVFLACVFYLPSSGYYWMTAVEGFTDFPYLIWNLIYCIMFGPGFDGSLTELRKVLGLSNIPKTLYTIVYGLWLPLIYFILAASATYSALTKKQTDPPSGLFYAWISAIVAVSLVPLVQSFIKPRLKNSTGSKRLKDVEPQISFLPPSSGFASSSDDGHPWKHGDVFEDEPEINDNEKAPPPY